MVLWVVSEFHFLRLGRLCLGHAIPVSQIGLSFGAFAYRDTWGFPFECVIEQPVVAHVLIDLSARCCGADGHCMGYLATNFSFGLSFVLRGDLKIFVLGIDCFLSHVSGWDGSVLAFIIEGWVRVNLLAGCVVALDFLVMESWIFNALHQANAISMAVSKSGLFLSELIDLRLDRLSLVAFCWMIEISPYIHLVAH